MSLARLSGILCKDAQFLEWLAQESSDKLPVTPDEAAEVVYMVCGIDSRRELDSNTEAAELFHRHLRRPFLAWRDKEK
jgi:hypothetical protein